MVGGGWRRSGDIMLKRWQKLSFYFPSISFLSGSPSAFPLILKRAPVSKRERKESTEEGGWTLQEGERRDPLEWRRVVGEVELGGGCVWLVFQPDLLVLPIFSRTPGEDDTRFIFSRCWKMPNAPEIIYVKFFYGFFMHGFSLITVRF